MTISTGERLPEANLMRMGAEGPEEVSLGDLTAGRKVVIFAVPGAYTPTCHSAHVPSFIRNMGALGENSRKMPGNAPSRPGKRCLRR